MPLDGEYEPSTWDWVRKQVERYEASGGRVLQHAARHRQPVVIVTTRGNKTAKVRKLALMRVEHDGEYALIGSMGESRSTRSGCTTCALDPAAVTVQDGPEPIDMTVREVESDERAVVVGASRRGLPALRRVPGQDRPPDPRLHRVPKT